MNDMNVMDSTIPIAIIFETVIPSSEMVEEILAIL